MKSEAQSFEPHLVINEISLPPAAEWAPRVRGWVFIHVSRGAGYWQQTGGMRQLNSGSMLVLVPEAKGALRASQLGEVGIVYFSLQPEKLTGLLSLSEQQALERAAERASQQARVLEPEDVLSERFKNLCLNRNGGGFSQRLQLLQIFTDSLQNEPMASVESSPDVNSRLRLKQYLKNMVASEFLELSLSDLVPQMHCSLRHLSRLFHEEVGMSFRDKQAELRLSRACHLLTTTNIKLIDVALASGYQSNSLFNLSFKRRFGVPPSKWRSKFARKQPLRQKIIRMLPV